MIITLDFGLSGVAVLIFIFLYGMRGDGC